jgi:hypothetical protein
MSPQLAATAARAKGDLGEKILMTVSLVLALIGLAPSAEGTADRQLLPPVRLHAAGKPIDTAVGHAAPFVGDFDGDGVNDLLVGQFGDGLLWVYRNTGGNGAPRLAPGFKFKGGKEEGRVPTG